jgi:AraC family ethanolamine operon transcriptional activator
MSEASAPQILLDTEYVELDAVAANDAEVEYDTLYRQLTPASSASRSRFVTVGDLVLTCERLQPGVQVEGHTPPDVVTLGFVLGPEAGRYRGDTLQGERIAVAGPRTLLDVTLPPGAELYTLLVPHDVWDRETDRSAESDFAQLSPEALSRFTRWARRLGSCGQHELADLGSPAERALLRTISSGSPADRLTSARRLALVRACEDRLLAQPEHPPSLLELTHAQGVSERTLHYAFQQERNASPFAHLRCLRLNEVRAELLAADMRETTVAAIARGWGFQNLGRFSAAYRQLFGELPRETLRRR